MSEFNLAASPCRAGLLSHCHGVPGLVNSADLLLMSLVIPVVFPIMTTLLRKRPTVRPHRCCHFPLWADFFSLVFGCVQIRFDWRPPPSPAHFVAPLEVCTTCVALYLCNAASRFPHLHLLPLVRPRSSSSPHVFPRCKWTGEGREGERGNRHLTK